MRVAEGLAAATRRLEAAGVRDARTNARRLLAHALGLDLGGLVARRDESIEPAAAARFEALLARRASREPLQHLTGEQEFRGLAFLVDRRVLIPRPETEGVVDAALALLPRGGLAIDLGTGSGCIAIAIADARPDVEVLALERSGGALDVARANAARLGVARRVALVEGDFREPPEAWRGRADVVVSNPPYVSEDAFRDLEPEVRDHEPREALVPGPSGLEAYRALAPVALGLLRPGGSLVLELGWDSEAGAREAVAAAGFDSIDVRPDLRRIPRVLTARRREVPT